MAGTTSEVTETGHNMTANSNSSTSRIGMATVREYEVRSSQLPDDIPETYLAYVNGVPVPNGSQRSVNATTIKLYSRAVAQRDRKSVV